MAKSKSTEALPTNQILRVRLHLKSRSDRLLQLMRLVGGANLDKKISLSIKERQKNHIKMAECDDDRSH